MVKGSSGIGKTWHCHSSQCLIRVCIPEGTAGRGAQLHPQAPAASSTSKLTPSGCGHQRLDLCSFWGPCFLCPLATQTGARRTCRPLPLATQEIARVLWEHTEVGKEDALGPRGSVVLCGLRGGGDPVLTLDASADAWTRTPQLLQSHWFPRGALTESHQFLHSFSW